MISPASSLFPIPPPVPVDTHPNRVSGPESPGPERIPDPDRLAPEDAYFNHSLSRVRSVPLNYEDGLRSLRVADSGLATLLPSRGTLGADLTRKDAGKIGASGARRRRKGAWKKLLWVKQSYPDNYTDTETFLDHLQRNPRVRPYDFWPLVADSTVIVQHVCSVVIFICCFVGIVQDRVSPVSIVCWGSVGTAMGWILWDNWIWEEQTELARNIVGVGGEDDESTSSSIASAPNPSANDPQSTAAKADTIHGLGLSISPTASKDGMSHLAADENASPGGIGDSSLHSAVSSASPGTAVAQADLPEIERASLFSSRNRQRLATVKSAFLIYFSLLGLSPILKSLTKSTASDSIWALSCWLLIMNIFSFDYGSGEGAGATTKFPASLSTNAAVMASTVLASRLPSTTHVFSLMLFSMEVFGLFPIFRRQLRQKSWTGHVLLTLGLVIIAGGAVGTTLGGGWGSAVIGSFLGSLLTAFAMGGCSWWLISLQKYKNVVIGPWDPARPIIRRHWN
ncbi:hypothetical protein POX_g08862 [Penicillium oxalicum]|uniref:hypothetical protein n=1 Tax=Penicillium oxalicum TaxID=69781 RepID=UPI0020B8CDDB|nr:hypothetical protein POX_g08862 [Penicillium oxalicum]KAI2786476.1 hypothetical protein POX_g08862 [Penicillium oxalicum]